MDVPGMRGVALRAPICVFVLRIFMAMKPAGHKDCCDTGIINTIDKSRLLCAIRLCVGQDFSLGLYFFYTHNSKNIILMKIRLMFLTPARSTIHTTAGSILPFCTYPDSESFGQGTKSQYPGVKNGRSYLLSLEQEYMFPSGRLQESSECPMM